PHDIDRVCRHPDFLRGPEIENGTCRGAAIGKHPRVCFRPALACGLQEHALNNFFGEGITVIIAVDHDTGISTLRRAYALLSITCKHHEGVTAVDGCAHVGSAARFRLRGTARTLAACADKNVGNADALGVGDGPAHFDDGKIDSTFAEWAVSTLKRVKVHESGASGFGSEDSTGLKRRYTESLAGTL